MQQQDTGGEAIGHFGELLQNDLLRNSHILQLLPTAAYICDTTGVIIYYNAKAVELWGRIPEKGEKDERAWPGTQSPVACCIKDGSSADHIELTLERHGLPLMTVDISTAPIKDDDGTMLGVISCFNDITEQKKTQKALEWKARQLQDYIDNAAIGLHWVDGNGIIKWANKAELELLGYTEEEYLGHHISEFHAEPDKIKEILHRLSCNETLRGYEALLRCKDGHLKAVHISSNVFWDEGNFIHTRCFTVDVTGQKEMLSALKESESRYQQLIQKLPAALYVTDAEGRITLYNKAAADLWRSEPQRGDLWCGCDILNVDGSDLLREESPMAIATREKQAIYDREILLIRPDQSVRHVACYPQPYFNEDGATAGAIHLLVDITEMKRTQAALEQREKEYRNLAASLEMKVIEKVRDLHEQNEKLRTSEERYHKMIDEVEDYAIILLDKEGIIQNWNKGAEKIKGYKEHEIVGRSFNNFYLPADRKNGLPQQLLKEASEKGKATHEGWRMRRDGSIFWGSIVLTALHDDENQLIGYSKVTRDLTERKMAEDKLKEYTNQLEFQNKELEQFAYAASHDMKEPLRKIQLYNTAIAENPANILDEKSKEYLDRSVAASQRMTNLIEDLLAYARTAATIDSFEKVNINEIIEEITLIHKEEFEENNIHIEAADLPVIYAIPFQIKQLFFNLINNAIKYRHPQREALIRINYEMVDRPSLKDPHMKPGQAYHKLSVIDNGLGFESHFAEKIFNIFQRLNNSPGTGGSGVGLAICKRIVQNHQGLIEATSEQNQGTRFDIYFPAAL